jgi:hypothetical protein
MVTSPSHAAMRSWTERPNDSEEDSANLPDPDILAQGIADDLRSALGQIEGVLSDLRYGVPVDPEVQV